MSKKPNLLFFGIDSMRAEHMSLYGYDRLTTPNIDKYLEGGIVFEKCLSPHIPTTPGYSSMLTGLDAFGTNVVALRHKGGLPDNIKTLAEVLRENGYDTSCIGFTSNPASRGFDKYIEFESWGSWEAGRSPKAENLNAVAIPELERLAAGDKPWFLFMRHMDPHSPYLPPEPFHRMFYGKDEFDPENHTLDPVYAFKPFCDYFRSWFAPGCTDKDYIIANYDGAVAYMDACIQNILSRLEGLGLEEETLVVFVSDHGETLYDHDCYFDHHGLYECTINVPFALRWKGHLPEGKRYSEWCSLQDVMPTILDVMGIDPQIDYRFDGQSLMTLANGGHTGKCEYYITEATWERKHGWRTPEWKLIEALEPDFHFKPAVELYNLVTDPGELHNVADENPEIVAALHARMEAHIAKRKAEVGHENPMDTNLDWHGLGCGPFKTSQQAYDSMHIGDPETARRLQAEGEKRNK
ncbi:MAG: sulfatase [Clostridiaceae bacterium]|nr:sulfatase [Clostridiaceae bacterium]MDY3072935.1 sulfatase [Eubacteriales bacterium]MDY3285761.1 sulfatase [Eubacteriales bacterium]MDY5016314.1 sulfatase [Eubacteriales bacterium]